MQIPYLSPLYDPKTPKQIARANQLASTKAKAQKMYAVLYEIYEYTDELTALKASINNELVDMINNDASDRKIEKRMYQIYLNFIAKYQSTYDRIMRMKAFL